MSGFHYSWLCRCPCKEKTVFTLILNYGLTPCLLAHTYLMNVERLFD